MPQIIRSLHSSDGFRKNSVDEPNPGRYVRVQATCKQVVTTAILKRPKALILSTEQGDLRLRMQQRIRKPEVGEVFTLYLADDAHLYQGDEGYIVSAYLAFAREPSAVSTSLHP